MFARKNLIAIINLSTKLSCQKFIQPSITAFYKPVRTFIFDKKKKEDENMKRFKQLNQEFKNNRESRKFQIAQQKIKPGISDQEVKKQTQAAQKIVDSYLESYKFETKFDEMKFLNMISEVSYCYDNKSIIENPRFADLIQEKADNLSEFKDLRVACLFLSFCSNNDVNRPQIWGNFNSFFKNNLKRLGFEEKYIILTSYTEKNKSEIGEFFDLFENEFLKDVKKEKGVIDYYSLYRVLILYRKYEQGSENFFYTIQDIVKKNYNEMGMEHLVMFLQHYATCLLEDQVVRHELMTLFEERLSKSHVFLNNSQIVAVLYSFIRYGKGSDTFYTIMQSRTITLIDTFTLDQLQKLIVLYANLPKYAGLVFSAIETHVRKNFKKIPRPFLSTLFQNLVEFGYGAEETFNMIANFLVGNVYNMTNDEFVRNLFAFSIERKVYKENYFTKAAECAKTKMNTYTGKEIATMVWSFSNVGLSDTELYDMIEQEIYDRLDEKKFSLREISSILWSYVQRVPLRPPTVDLMKSEIIRLKEEAEAWDVAIAVWGFSKFEGYPINDLLKSLSEKCEEVIPEMNEYELSISLRAYAEAQIGSESLYKTFMIKTLEVLNSLNYSETITCLYSFSIVNCVPNEIFKEVIEKLKESAKHLQHQIQVSKEAEVEPENPFQNVDEYLRNEAIEKLKREQ